MNSSQLANFSVQFTFSVREASEISKIVDKFISYYADIKEGEFSCRILLPHDIKSNYDARKFGAVIQGEILLSMKKNKLKPNLRDFRYIHDDDNYGWLLLSPKIAEKLKFFPSKGNIKF